jgi:Trk-type K+ transport system membrane component
MKRLKQPDCWFLVTLLVITAGGAFLLSQSGATRPEAQHLSYSRHHWQAAFDALSASCGVGLLTYGFFDDYTPRGRWILTALGAAGALLFLAAATHVARRMQAAEARVRVPHPLLVVGVFLIVQASALAIFLLLNLIGRSATSAAETSWRAIGAFSSLGWASEGQRGAAAWPLALLAWLGALGWPVWLLVVPRLRRRCVPVRAALAMFSGYTVSLLLVALLVSAFEAPRAAGGRDAAGQTLSRQSWPTRYARSLVQTAAASGAGMPTESLAERDASAGTQITLSALLLVGGLGGSATGGMQWPLLLWALAGGALALGWPRGANPALDLTRWMHAGLACLFLLTGLALVVALGLLLIENWTASPFQPPPTFADAWLDACSAVAGGDLSGGLTGRVTSRNLLSGIHQATNLYQYGMIWLMLAMLAGRMLPLVVLRRLGDTLGTSDPEG